MSPVRAGGFRLLLAAALTACASVSQPPGGVQNKIPPVVVSVTPDSGATRVTADAVRFTFDKVVNNPPSGSDRSLNQLFLISPVDGLPKVSWHRDRIDVHPRHGFRANTAYSVTMLPGVTDMIGNSIRTPRTIVFSTGDSIPPLGVLGRAFDWTAGTPASGALVQALPIRDTMLVYMAVTDSSGQFSVGPLGAGTYVVRGFLDEDHNRALGHREKWDADTLTLRDSRPAIELDLIERDTVPPRIATIQAGDSVTLTISFDMALNPAVPMTPANIRVQRSDSSALTVTAVQTAEAAQLARTDSIARADSLAALTAPGSTRDTAAAAVPLPGAKPPLPPAARPRAPAPGRVLVVHLAASTPLEVGKQYLITATGLHNLLGRTGTATRVYTVPKPVVPVAPPPRVKPPAPRS